MKMNFITAFFQYLVYLYILGKKSYVRPFPVEAKVNTDTMDFHASVFTEMPVQATIPNLPVDGTKAEQDRFKFPDVTESTPAVVTNSGIEEIEKMTFTMDLTDASQTMDAIETAEMNGTSNSNGTANPNETTDISETSDRGDAAEIKDVTDLYETTEVRHTVHRGRRKKQRKSREMDTTGRLDVCYPCGGSQQVDHLIVSDSIIFSTLAPSAYDDSKDYPLIYLDTVRARRDNHALMRDINEMRLGRHHDRSNKTIRHHHGEMKVTKHMDVSKIFNSTAKEVKLSEFLQNLFDILAIGVLHFQHMVKDEDSYSKFFTRHLAGDFRTFEQSLKNVLCGLRKLRWSRNLQGEHCSNISTRHVTQYFLKDFKMDERERSRSNRFYRDFVTLNYIDVILKTIEKTFSCLQSENNFPHHSWSECMQA